MEVNCGDEGDAPGFDGEDGVMQEQGEEEVGKDIKGGEMGEEGVEVVEMEDCGEEDDARNKGEDTLEFDKVSGICCVLGSTDKTVSGEYVLARPPKKPGGVYLFLLMVSGVINCVESKRDYDEPYRGENFSRCAMILLSFVMLLLIFLFWERGRDIWNRFRITTKVYELFDDKFNEFRGGLNISDEYAGAAWKTL